MLSRKSAPEILVLCLLYEPISNKSREQMETHNRAKERREIYYIQYVLVLKEKTKKKILLVLKNSCKIYTGFCERVETFFKEALSYIFESTIRLSY